MERPNAIERRRHQSTSESSGILHIVLILSVIAVLILAPLLYIFSPFDRYFYPWLRPRDICQYQIPMRYDFDIFLEEFSIENTPFLESLRNVSWQSGLVSEVDIKLIAVFKAACVIASIYPKNACGYKVLVHPLCSSEITSLNISEVKRWVNFQKNIFVPIVKENMLLLPVNLVWIESMPQPFRAFASAGAILADLLICDEDLSLEMGAFETLKTRLPFSNYNETSSTFWFPGKAEDLYWTFRLHRCCLKEGIQPAQNNELGFFRRLASFVLYLHRIAKPFE